MNVRRLFNVVELGSVALLSGLVVYLLVVVVPRFEEVLAPFEEFLPYLTRAVFAASGFMRAWWWLFFGLAVVGALCLQTLLDRLAGPHSSQSGAPTARWRRLALISGALGLAILLIVLGLYLPVHIPGDGLHPSVIPGFLKLFVTSGGCG